jgi:hypothetical protein
MPRKNQIWIEKPKYFCFHIFYKLLNRRPFWREPVIIRGEKRLTQWT